MIDTTLKFIGTELQNYIQREIDAETDVLLENIALFETNQKVDLEGIVISLVNIEEESAMKNTPAVKKNGAMGIEYANPPIFLNLYVLMCANFPGKDYSDALNRLSGVIRFFQIKNSFTITPAFLKQNASGPEDVQLLKITLELYTLTFEQLNHLWGALGGRQLPFVMYKVRMASIYDRRVTIEGPPIEIIESSTVQIEQK